jgi:hypothetical protein
MTDARFEVFMVIKILAKFFWAVMLCSVVLGYPKDGSSMDI